MALVERILSVIALHSCLICQQEGALLCNACAYEAFEPIPERCYRCLRLSRDAAVCKACKKESPLRHVWVVTDYADYAKHLVHLLKFERARSAHSTIGKAMSEILPYLGTETVVTHVPTATSRERRRGYDQSHLVAQSIAKHRSLKHQTLLRRYGQMRQVGASRAERLRHAQTMYGILDAGKVESKQILLVDDILTTGASLEAAAKVLKAAGAKQVDAIVFAQKH